MQPIHSIHSLLRMYTQLQIFLCTAWKRWQTSSRLIIIGKLFSPVLFASLSIHDFTSVPHNGQTCHSTSAISMVYLKKKKVLPHSEKDNHKHKQQDHFPEKNSKVLGEELTLLIWSQFLIQSVWYWCLHGNVDNVSSSSYSKRQIAHLFRHI